MQMFFRIVLGLLEIIFGIITFGAFSGISHDGR